MKSNALMGHLLTAALLLPGLALAQTEGGWTGDQNACRHRNPRPQTGESLSWTGGCVDGLAEGEGTQQWFLNGVENGRYEGSMAHGRYEGHGRFRGVRGDVYEGEHAQGLREGHGVLTLSRGGAYDGEFHRGLPQGEGVLTLPGGKVFSGHFLAGALVGTGTQTIADGTNWAGEFRAGMAVGVGVKTLPDGSRIEGVDPIQDRGEEARVSNQRSPVGVRVCTKLGRPVPPALSNWAGQVGVRSTITIEGGRAVAVQNAVTRSTGDPRADSLFIQAVADAVMKTYECPGDHVIVQDFVFNYSR